MEPRSAVLREQARPMLILENVHLTLTRTEKSTDRRKRKNSTTKGEQRWLISSSWINTPDLLQEGNSEDTSSGRHSARQFSRSSWRISQGAPSRWSRTGRPRSKRVRKREGGEKGGYSGGHPRHRSADPCPPRSMAWYGRGGHCAPPSPICLSRGSPERRCC